MSNTRKDTWDAIVIGSGMGGMAAAAALSKTGHRVLMLEQYKTLGGQTHSFSREGFSWDVGIHYLSGIAPGELDREIIDWLSETPIDFEPMGAVYDNLHIGETEPLAVSRPYEAQEMDLKDRFPEQAQAIEAWTAALRQGREAMYTVISTRAMPALMGSAVKWWNRHAIERWCNRTTQEVIDEITPDLALRAAFAAQWGDHGGRPSRASFAMHALISGSYLECGAWYPVGGAGVIAKQILPTISANGGEARAGTCVDKLLLEDQKVVGVRTTEGEEIRAEVVLSSIGARETVTRLLPEGSGHDDWINEVLSLSSSIAHFSLFLGFEGDVQAAGATKSNHWLYPTGEVDALWGQAPDGAPPGMFVSFASLKDPDHNPGPAKKHHGEVIAWTDWSTVAQWADTEPDRRGEDYQDFKRRVEDALFEQFRSYFPALAELVVFRELSTPLATAAITGHHQGAFYGLEVTPERVISDALRASTPIDGLYLSGQDVASPGVPGALWGGLLAAASVDPNVFPHLRK
ncbi:MAG: phytoene desaturase family protein [Burkholderiaceae bacterium]